MCNTLNKTVLCPRDCYDTCIYEVKYDPEPKLIHTGKPTIKLSCPRAEKDFARVSSPDRILHPYIAVSKREGKRKKVSWSYAIGLIVNKLKETLKAYGASRILFLDYAGNRGIFTRYLAQRLWYFLGAARVDYTICNGAGAKALMLHYGSTYGALPQHMEQANILVYWGFNAAITSPHNFFYALSLRERKHVKIITIDTLKTETAKLSDIWLQPRYGTDTYLALGIASYLIQNELYDREFIEKHTYGFEMFRKYVRGLDLNTVSNKTKIPRDDIIEFAELYSEKKPSIIFIGYGLQRRIGGGEAVRAISLLPALIGIHRGFYYSNTDGLLIDMQYLTGSFLGVPSRTIPQSKIGEYIYNGEFKFIYIHLTNPAATHPRANLIREGLLRDDVFVVVHETHWSDTAKLADVVLPAPTWLEKRDVVFSFWHNYIGFNRPVLNKPNTLKTELGVMRLIAKGLNIKEKLIYESPMRALIKAIGRSIYEELITKGFTTLPYRKLNEYQTPSGKIEFYSNKAKEFNLSPLPKPIEVHPPPDYPYILISSAHPRYTHTQFEDVYGPIPPIIEISEEDMEKLSITDGESVIVSSKNGSVVLMAKESDRVPPGVVFAYRSCKTLDGKRLNCITNDETNELGGATINTTFVSIIPLRCTSTSKFKSIVSYEE